MKDGDVLFYLDNYQEGNIMNVFLENRVLPKAVLKTSNGFLFSSYILAQNFISISRYIHT
jgi:hypothetical protein